MALLEVSRIRTANEYNNSERTLLMLLLENHALFLDFEWHLMVPEGAKGKLHYFFQRKLNVGTKGLQKLLRSLQNKGVVERRDVKRGRSFAMRYLLTSDGELLARELLKEREDYPIPQEQFMRILVKSEDGRAKEEPLFAIKEGGAIVSIDTVTIRKEIKAAPVRKEYIYVKEDIVVVTKQVSAGSCKIVVKGSKVKIDPEVYEKAKRVCRVTEACEDFEYCIQTPLDTKECFSSITLLKQGTRAKRIWKEWKNKSAGAD